MKISPSYSTRFGDLIRVAVEQQLERVDGTWDAQTVCDLLALRDFVQEKDRLGQRRQD